MLLRVLQTAMVFVFVMAVFNTFAGQTGMIISITLDHEGCSACNNIKADVMDQITSHSSMEDIVRVAFIKKGRRDEKRLIRWAKKLCPHTEIILADQISFDGLKIELENRREHVWETEKLFRNGVCGEILKWIHKKPLE